MLDTDQTLIDELVATADLHGHRTLHASDSAGLALEFLPYPEPSTYDPSEIDELVGDHFENWPWRDIATHPVGRTASSLFENDDLNFVDALDLATGVRVAACIKHMFDVGYDFPAAGDAETAAWLVEHFDFEPGYAHVVAIAVNEHSDTVLEALEVA
jgi:hypothetical protein